jgi:hypothetical protein
VVLVNDLDKMVRAIKAVSPNTFILARLRDDGTKWPDAIPITGNRETDRVTGRQRFWKWHNACKGIAWDALSCDNEWLSQDNPALLAAGCEIERAIMDEATAAGVRVGIGNFNTGQPQGERPEIIDAMRPMLQQAQNQGHVLVIHLYPINGDLTADYDRLVARWEPVFEGYPRLRVMVGEYAPDVRGDGGDLLMLTGDTLAARYPQIIGFARYTLGVGWSEFQFDTDEYRRYVLAHR